MKSDRAGGPAPSGSASPPLPTPPAGAKRSCEDLVPLEVGPASRAGRGPKTLPPGSQGLPQTSPSAPTPASLRGWIARQLLRWFAQSQRSLPWRRDRDPYRIWVSEVMLQQTQVATVVPYFERFLTVFPTLSALAAAEEQDVLRLWEGLGYYRRARDLHRAARQLAARDSGIFPRDPPRLQGLPGMGRYTINAVLSQAFDRRLPILEANSERVLCRLLGRTEDPKRAPLRPWLWQAAAELLPRKRVGAFNQALMELGALVCTPVAPRCGECPLRKRCQAQRLGLQESIPFRATPPDTVPVKESAVVLWRQGRVLLLQRPGTGRWANLWEFPHGPLDDGETHDQAATRLLSTLTGCQGDVGTELTTIRHGVTRFAITLVCFEARHRSGDFRPGFYQEGLWVAPTDLSGYPVSAPQRRLARHLIEPGRQQSLF
jgi:A/G-specific adenine glycosylase